MMTRPFIFLALLLLGLGNVQAQEARTFRDKLILYLEGARKASEAVQDAEAHKALLDDLYILGSDVASDYFEFSSEEEFEQDRLLLKDVIIANRRIRLLFIPLGNAMINQARKVVRKHEAEVRHYRIAAAIGGAILGGLAGASYQLVRKTSSALRLAVVVSGGTLGGAAGYFFVGPLASRIFIDFDLSIQKSEDFLLRYPYATRLADVEEAEDLAMALEDLEADR